MDSNNPPDPKPTANCVLGSGEPPCDSPKNIGAPLSNFLLSPLGWASEIGKELVAAGLSGFQHGLIGLVGLLTGSVSCCKEAASLGVSGSASRACHVLIGQRARLSWLRLLAQPDLESVLHPSKTQSFHARLLPTLPGSSADQVKGTAESFAKSALVRWGPNGWVAEHSRSGPIVARTDPCFE